MIYALAAALLLLFCLLYPFLALFGFFESRKDGRYLFLAKRFLAATVLFIVLFVSIRSLVFLGVTDIVLQAIHAAETGVLKNRASSEFGQNNLGVMFPEILTKNKKRCYQAALSNYIEDQWKESFRRRACEIAPEACAENELEFFKKVREGLKQKKIPLSRFPKAGIEESDMTEGADFGSYDLAATGATLSITWAVFSDMFKVARKLFQYPDNKGQMPEALDEQTAANYRRYFSSCSAFKPQPWTNVGDEIVSSRARSYFGEKP